MKGLVERQLERGERVVVLDPLSSWWGLRVRADGKPGYPVAVIGGPQADVPLDATKGDQLGAFLASTALSAVIDVGDLRRSQQLIPFAADLLEALYRENREPLTIVLEEADVFAPQSPAKDGTRRMLDAADQIARRGRARGLRLWTITQRPARLHKDVLTQASTLLLLRLRAPQDRDAAAAWVRGNADPAQATAVIDQLASLPTGEGFVYAPDFDLLERVKFPPIATLDTSATPKAGDKRPKEIALAEADVGALRQALAGELTEEAAGPATPGRSRASLKAEFDRGVLAGLERGRREGEEAGLARGYEAGFGSGFQRGVSDAKRALDKLEPGPPPKRPSETAASLLMLTRAPAPTQSDAGARRAPRPTPRRRRLSPRRRRPRLQRLETLTPSSRKARAS